MKLDFCNTVLEERFLLLRMEQSAISSSLLLLLFTTTVKSCRVQMVTNFRIGIFVWFGVSADPTRHISAIN